MSRFEMGQARRVLGICANPRASGRQARRALLPNQSPRAGSIPTGACTSCTIVSTPCFWFFLFVVMGVAISRRVPDLSQAPTGGRGRLWCAPSSPHMIDHRPCIDTMSMCLLPPLSFSLLLLLLPSPLSFSLLLFLPSSSFPPSSPLPLSLPWLSPPSS